MGLKIDLKKEQKPLYAPSAKEVTLVEVPAMDFLMADGAGDPNTAAAFHEAVEALYSLSYTLKFMVKKGQGIDYAVLPWKGSGGPRVWKPSLRKPWIKTAGSGR